MCIYSKNSLKLMAAAAALITVSAQAGPVAVGGSEGYSVVVSSPGSVQATFQGNAGAYTNLLYLGSTLLFNNQTTPVGTSVDLGSFAAGTELVFRMRVNDTDQDFFTGPASRNPDQHAHARVQGDWQPGVSLVSFEDVSFGSDFYNLFGFRYDDLSFSLSNARAVPSVAAIPEPETYALFAAGLGVLGLVARRRNTLS